MKLSDYDLRQLDEKVIHSLSPDAVQNLAVNLLDDLKDSRERLNQNSQNSSRPPSSQAPWDKASAHADNDDVGNDDESSGPLTEDEALTAAAQIDVESPSNDTEPEKDENTGISNASDWCEWMDQQGIVKPLHRKIVTEGALMGGLLDQGVPSDFSIISDDAGQFNVFDHALCWIHAERVINRLIPLNDDHIEAVDEVREQLWSIYHDLKAYKLNPVTEQADSIRQRFQILCSTKTCYETLNQALRRMGKNQHELLRVLDKPYLPLHNNLSERDIRDYVKKRKISGSTRSDAGRKARDTFASLKKTCRKHGISFWDYLNSRLLNTGDIPPLSGVIRAAAASG